MAAGPGQGIAAGAGTLKVGVIGGGMVGIATAIWAQRTGHEVTLIDKSPPQDRASYGNAGVLASSSVLPVTMPGLIGKIPKMLADRSEPIFVRWPYLPRLAPWAVRYLSHANEKEVRRIARALVPIIGNSLDDHLALSEGTPARRHIKACDFAVLFKDRAAFAETPLPWDIRRELGFEWQEHAGAARRSYDPVLGDSFDFLLALQGHGQITDPGAYSAALTEYFVARGGRFLKARVTDIAHSDGQVTGIVTKDGVLACDRVAITAGAASPLLTRKLGLRIPVEAESGYHLEFWNPSAMPKAPVQVPTRKLILSPMEGRLRVAGAVEFGGLQNRGTERVFDALKHGLDRIIPGLTYERETRWMGHRPAPTDSIPVIDQLPHIKGVFLGFGHQHVGLTGSARTGQILAGMMAGRVSNIDMAPYRVSRFTKGGGPAQPARAAGHVGEAH